MLPMLRLRVMEPMVVPEQMEIAWERSTARTDVRAEMAAMAVSPTATTPRMAVRAGRGLTIRSKRKWDGHTLSLRLAVLEGLEDVAAMAPQEATAVAAPREETAPRVNRARR